MSAIDSITKLENYKSYIYKVPIVFIYRFLQEIYIDRQKESEGEREKGREIGRERDRKWKIK